MKEFVENDKDNFSGSYSVDVRDFSQPLKVKMTFWVEYTFTEANRDKVNPFNSEVIIQICKMLTNAGVRFTGIELGTVDTKPNKQFDTMSTLDINGNTVSPTLVESKKNV